MVGRVIVLAHSPFVGPASWGSMPDVLVAAGHDVAVPDLRSSAQGPYWRQHAMAIADCRPSVIVAHSGAGPLVPAAVEASTTNPLVVMVDATLPHPARSRFAEMPDDLERRLRALESHGRLPPWPEWFPAEVLRTVLPDDGMRAAFVAGCPEVPLALLVEPMPETAPLDPERSAYVQLSGRYEAAAADAGRAGWAVRRLDLHHLAPLTHPTEVADAVTAAVAALE